ncbi:MAG: transglycosylase domain-containing protein [Bowdeniella nasicola]|nr:transglycosylase domain-containing protein [Bowdeniella nasicola]
MRDEHRKPRTRRELREAEAARARARRTRGTKKRAVPAAARGRRRRYPRPGKGPILRWLPSWKLVLGTLAFVAALGLGAFALAYALLQVPEPDDFARAETSTVTYADGTTPLGSFSEFDRQIVSLADLPEHVGHAVVASEDRRFYTNPGIDVRGIVRAMWNNIQGKPLQGASTLTQQYVERYYVGTTKSIPGKAKEAILALKIDRQQSKEEILENYLNTIYFGRGAYGIQVAAEHYFGKDAADLTISESALLAGVIPAPSVWDPRVSPDRAEERWARVLDLMVEDGWITAEERAAQTFPETLDYQPTNALRGPEGYLVDMVKKEVMERADITEDELNTRGLTIISTIDAERQQAAVDAVQSLPEDRPENNTVGLASMDPATGALQAVYAGPDFLNHPRNAVTQDRAQAGSTFKVWTLITALSEGYSLYDTFPSATDMTIEGFDRPVRNYDRVNRGYINLVRSTQDSVNTPYAQLNVELGPERTMKTAVAAGIPEDTPGLEPVPSNVLGPASLRPIDQLRAYGTIASGGERHEPYIVAEIHDDAGRTIYTAESSGTRVFASDVIADATYAMQEVTRSGTAHYVGEHLGRPAAGKTGSSNDYKSAWFAGFTPQLVTVVDMYQVGPNGEEEELTGFGGIRTIAGGTYPTQIWTHYMKAALEGTEVLEFPEPTGKRATKHPSPKPTRTETPSPTPSETESPEPSEEPSEDSGEDSSERPSGPEPSESPKPSPSPSGPPPDANQPSKPGGSAAPGGGRGSGTGGSGQGGRGPGG